MNKNIVYFLLFFVLISCAYAQPPFQTGADLADTLTVIYPKDDYYLYNSTFNFHVHVVNSSGAVLTNDLYDCFGHFYGTQGQHQLEIDGVDDSNNYDEYFIINSTLTKTIGTHPYNIFCNSSNGEYGFVSADFIISTTSEEQNTNGTGLLAVIILIPLILGLFLIIGAATMGQEHAVLRIIMFLLAPIMTFVSSHYGMIGIVKYYGLIELQEAIGTTTYWSAWIFFVLVSYFIIYFIWKATEVAAQKKKERLEY